jgi:hypothetical protein
MGMSMPGGPAGAGHPGAPPQLHMMGPGGPGGPQKLTLPPPQVLGKPVQTPPPAGTAK